MQWFSDLGESALQDLAIVPVLLNLVLAAILGQILSLHYRRFSGVLSNKRKFAPILLFIAMTTMLVISIVKTSLALSLGLVGALSIIRFRTPIKEPEELAYLFLSVALGIGLGADQRLATTVMFVGILLVITILKRDALDRNAARTLIHVNADLDEAQGGVDSALQRLLERLKDQVESADLRRVDARERVLDASLILELADASRIGKVISSVQEILPGAAVSVIESGSVD